MAMARALEKPAMVGKGGGGMMVVGVGEGSEGGWERELCGVCGMMRGVLCCLRLGGLTELAIY